jgi:MFS family permease
MEERRKQSVDKLAMRMSFFLGKLSTLILAVDMEPTMYCGTKGRLVAGLVGGVALAITGAIIELIGRHFLQDIPEGGVRWPILGILSGVATGFLLGLLLGSWHLPRDFSVILLSTLLGVLVGIVLGSSSATIRDLFSNIPEGSHGKQVAVYTLEGMLVAIPLGGAMGLVLGIVIAKWRNNQHPSTPSENNSPTLDKSAG